MLNIAFISIIGLLSGAIGPITGGAGLISVPALILIGLPAEFAIAATRAGSLGIWIAALIQFHIQKVKLKNLSHFI